MTLRWRRRHEPRPESPGRRGTDVLFDREPDEDARYPWSPEKRAAIRAVRAAAKEQDGR